MLFRSGEEDFSKFFGGYAFLSLESAIEEYEELNWKSHWFPIFYLDSRDYLVLLCKSENVAPISRIYIGGGENEQILFSSLTNMMLTIVECYETGAFYFDDYGYLTNSYYKQESIRQKYNLGTRNFRGGW